MNIGINNSDYLNNSSAAAGRTAEGTLNNTEAHLKNELDVSALKSGQTLSGEITSLDSGNVTIKLSNGQFVNARLSQNAGLSVGQLLSFEVNTRSNINTIELRPLFANLSADNTVSSALKAAGLSLTAQNISMTKTMMEEGMGIDRNSLLNMARSVNAYPASDPSMIVKMDKLGLAINELNVTQFENYSNFEHQIIDNVVNLSSDFANAVADLAANGGDKGLNLAGELLAVMDSDILPGEISMAEFGTELTNLYAALNTEIPDVISGKDILELYKSAISEYSLNSEDIGGDIAENGTAAGKDSLINPSAADTNSLVNNTAAGTDPLANPSAADTNSLVNNTAAGTDPLANPSAAGTDPLVNPSAELTNDNIYKALKELSQNGNFKEFLSDALKSQMTLTPDKVAEDGEVDRLYERIVKLSQKLMNISASAGNGLDHIAENAQKINDNVNFMNQLNEMVNYVQLPLKMAQENAHGELYVYSNKKNLAAKDGNLTALLHLDMEHLGPMDVYVSMKNFENVNTYFYMQSEELLDFIADNIHILDERLTAKGYSMSSKVSVKEWSAITPITEEFLKSSPEDTVRQVAAIGFDVRA